MSAFASQRAGQRWRANARSSLVSVLDVGSSKVTCIIARLRVQDAGDALPLRTHAVEVLGIGHYQSLGIKAGVVIDLSAAEQAIRHAVDAAERMARTTIESLIVNVSCGRIAGESFSASVPISGREVGEAEIGRVLAAGRAQARGEGREVIHSRPIGYALDADRGISDPRGMVGQILGVDVLVVTADEAPLRNLELCINRCHLAVESFVATPFASGLAVLADDEMQRGAAVVDFGGGTTTMAVFADGELVHADALAVGGRTITTDLARGLSLRLEPAERLKTMFGSTLGDQGDDPGLLDMDESVADLDFPEQVPLSAATRIINARIEEVCEVVRDRLHAAGFAALVGRRTVLTGGGSQLTGLTETARRILARNIRLGRPLGVGGLPEAAKGPAFATVVGLLVYPQVSEIEELGTAPFTRTRMTGTGYLARVGEWFRQSF